MAAERLCKHPGCTIVLPAHNKTGKPPEFCLNHRPRKNRRRDIATAVANGDTETAVGIAVATGLAVNEGAAHSSIVRRLAIAIRTNRGDKRAALAECGLDAPGKADEAARLLAEAFDKYADVIADKPGAFARVGEEIAFVLLARADDPTMSGQQAGSAFSSIAQGIERLNTGAKKAYTNVYVVVPGLDALRLADAHRLAAGSAVDGREPNRDLAGAAPDAKSRKRGDGLAAPAPRKAAKGRGSRYWRAPRAQ